MPSINRLFKLEGWLPLALVLGMLAVGVVAAWVLPGVVHFLDVDRCLDAGGRYDHGSNECIKPPSR